MATKKNFNNATLNIRLPDTILKQYEQIAHGIYKTPSELTRQLIIEYVSNRIDMLSALQPDASKQKPKTGLRPSQGIYPSGNDMNPDDDWL